MHDRETGGTQFLFPGLSLDEEARELDRLDVWTDNDANARILGAWMALVEPYQSLPVCNCPGCVAERDGRA